MAIKKTELYSSLWQSCDELRGGMDASQYKDYVLTLLFMKYVSDKYAGDPYGLIVVPAGGSFADMVRLKGDKEIGDKINKIIGRLADENDLKGVIDVADFNDEDKLGKGKEMVERLSKLVAIFDNLDLRASQDEDDDLLGDAYEYLMRQFATESGKRAGQFYTPTGVSQILARVIGISADTKQSQTLYDPTCGTGSLLLEVVGQAPNGLTVYGQEIDKKTVALAKMNMILHGINSAEIQWGNTLAKPYWLESDGSLKQFDFAVANPPFSLNSWSNGIDLDNDTFGRFEFGIPPKRNGDFAFLLHIVKSLNNQGKAAIVLPQGVLFRGGAEADIRRELLQHGYIKGIISLPANLIYGTGIPTCIVVIDKEGAAARKSVFMIDASREYVKDGNTLNESYLSPSNISPDYMGDGNKNLLSERDINQIVSTFNGRIDQPGFARDVFLTEIAENDFNLNIPRYIESNPHFLHLSVPDSYKVVTLGELGTLIAGQDIRNQIPKDPNNGLAIPFIRVSNITVSGELDMENWQMLLFANDYKGKKGHGLPGDILIVISGAIGRTAIVPDSLSNGVYFDRSICALRLDNKKISATTINRALQSEAGQVELASLSFGTAQRSIRKDELVNARLFIPPEHLSQEQMYAESLLETLTKSVIEPLKADIPLEDKYEQIATALEDALFTIQHNRKPLKERILERYPLPIAAPYLRMLKAAYNPYEQVSRLFELYESITYQ